MFDLDQLLSNAVANDASDVHIKSNQKPFFRITRRLMECEGEPVPPHVLMAALKKIIPEHLKEYFEIHHEADFSHEVLGVGRFRVNAYLAQGVPVIAMRSVKTVIPSIEGLNLPPILGKIADARRGLIIIAGTTGSGKSTTLAAMIEHMNLNSRRRILTVEDPIEYVFTDSQSIITQREIGHDTESFEQALRHVLRQDPDVIVIGEMRDPLSLKTALMAAETGHLVITTLHAATAPVAIPRMLEMFPNEEWDHMRHVFANVLQAVICQRLIRGTEGGMYPAVEVMMNTPIVKHNLEQNKLDQLASAIENGLLDGMQNFNLSLQTLIGSGKVTEEEGLKYATSQNALKMALGGFTTGNRRNNLR